VKLKQNIFKTVSKLFVSAETKRSGSETF